MQTVNFQCGNCNKLMAVSAEYLGQQVRCPHCQAVVVAPAAAAPAPVPASAAEPGPLETLSYQSPQLQEHDDIFAPPEPVDDLFGAPDAPRVEMPPPEPALAPAQNLTVDGAAPEALAPTVNWPPSQPAAPAPTDDATLPSWMDHPAVAPGAAVAAHGPDADGEHHEAPPALIRKPRDGGGWFVGLVFIPLISYSFLATVAVIVLWYRLQQLPPPPPNPLENLPSFDPSDPDRATHLTLNQTNQAPVFRNMDLKTVTWPLSNNYKVRLGANRKLRVGDLEVEPLGVEFQTVSVDVWGFEGKPEPCPYPSLVLRLKLRNVSDDVAFQPVDPYFSRKWPVKGAAGPPPLTFLELAGTSRPTHFFGGPAEFHLPPTPKSHEKPPEWVHGDNDTKVLKPGDQMETFVCTNGDDKAVSDAIEDYHGKLLWRIHVRRGLVKLDPHRYVPVSSVIGVEFTDDDYRKSS